MSVKYDASILYKTTFATVAGSTIFPQHINTDECQCIGN